MEQQENSIIKWRGERATYGYLIIMLAVFPLFYTDKLLNLVPDKVHFFLTITSLYFFLIILISVAAAKNHFWGKIVLKRSDTIFGIILLITVVISTIFAEDSKRAFFAIEQRNVSGLCFACCVMVYFAIREYGKFDGLILWSWLTGSFVIYLFGILCASSINFMYIQENLTAESKFAFLTPLGNIDINASYVSLFLPPIAVMYMICKDRFSQIIHGLNLYMGFMFTFFIKTESAVIAIGIGIFVSRLFWDL